MLLQMSKRKKKTQVRAAPVASAEDQTPTAFEPTSTELSDAGRTIASLLLFIHLFCVAVVLSGNFMPSQLQIDLASTVGIYTKTLHIDPNFVPFHFTDGEQAMTRLHQWQLLESSSSADSSSGVSGSSGSDGDFSIVYRLPQDAMRGGFNHQRQDMFARVAGFYAANEALDDEVAATMAKSIAEHVYANEQLSTKRWIVRCVKYIADADIRLEADESDSVSVLYEADVWLADSGEVNLLKRIESRRTAPMKSSVATTQEKK